MNEYYDIRKIRVQARSWRTVVPSVLGARAAAVEAAGGIFYGLFTGQIGLGANEGLVMTAWTELARLEECAALATDGVEEILSYEPERFAATVRPTAPLPPKEPGVYAHRSFEIQERDWPEFVALSEGAWPAFERANDSEILGFWRSLDVEAPRARVRLLTRYPSLAVWELSRGGRPDSKTDPQTIERFIRRHELTDATVVVTTQLARVSDPRS